MLLLKTEDYDLLFRPDAAQPRFDGSARSPCRVHSEISEQRSQPQNNKPIKIPDIYEIEKAFDQQWR
jgi:hypothetical protein